MYDIHVDTAKNRIYLTLEGFIDEPKAQACIAAFKAGIDQLQPGFIVISDLQGFKPVSRRVTELIAEGQQYELDHGMSKVVRIMDQHTLGIMQFERISKETGVPVVGVTSLAEAETLLNE